MGVPIWDAHFLCKVLDSGEVKIRQKENRTGKPVLLKMFDFSN